MALVAAAARFWAAGRDGSLAGSASPDFVFGRVIGRRMWNSSAGPVVIMGDEQDEEEEEEDGDEGTTECDSGENVLSGCSSTESGETGEMGRPH